MLAHPRPGFSLIGLLVTLVCIVILMAISMNALNKAVTGGGSPKEGTVRSTKDALNLQALHLALVLQAGDYDGRLVTPSVIVDAGGRRMTSTARHSNAFNIASSENHHLDTTANMYSALLAANALQPEQLVSANEYSGYVEEYYEYDRDAYDPMNGTYWDSGFKADLHRLSHASFAHLPLHGERYSKYWSAAGPPTVPIVSNRGPVDGIDDPHSMTYGRDGTWGGHLLFADGHVDFVTTFTPPMLMPLSDSAGAEPRPDNLFAMEQGPAGADVILSFTREMTADGPVLQFD